MERRHSDRAKSAVEIRDLSGQQHITGYAAVFYRSGDEGTEYPLTEQMIERVHPGAFDGIEQADVIGVFNHNDEYLLGRSINGTLKLDVDDVGLRYSIPFDGSDPDHVRVASKITRGDVTGSSFSFKNPVAKFTTETRNGKQINIRNINGLPYIKDVGPVTFPAYRGTAANFRSCVHARCEIDAVEAELARALAADETRKQQIADAVNFKFRYLNLRR